MKVLNRKSGIQKRYLRYTLALLVVTLILVGLGSWGYMQKNLTKAVSDKYEFVVEKMGISLDNLFEKSEEVPAGGGAGRGGEKCIEQVFCVCRSGEYCRILLCGQ